MLLLIIVFGAGVFVGYKYPMQVGQVVETAKRFYNDTVKKIFKKDTPPQG